MRYAHDTVSRFTSLDGLPGDTVRVIIESKDGLWIGYGGLARWKDRTFTSWTERDGLPGETVRALYEDPQGVLWIGTCDSGLGRFHDRRFTRYTTREGLFNDGVFQILELIASQEREGRTSIPGILGGHPKPAINGHLKTGN